MWEGSNCVFIEDALKIQMEGVAKRTLTLRGKLNLRCGKTYFARCWERGGESGRKVIGGGEGE